MLQSPNFLYLPELGAGRRPHEVALGPYELASRLSYFLIGSMPDDDLFAAADGDRLKTPDQVAEQTRRLLGSPRAREAIVSFFQQWLEISDLATIDKDSMIFPEFNAALKAAMVEEISAFVQHVTLDTAADGRLSTLLTAGYSFPGGPVRAIHGLHRHGRRQQGGPAAPGQRAGLLTLPGVMSVYSHPNQTGPVGRGYMVSDRMLCITPPPGAGQRGRHVAQARSQRDHAGTAGDAPQGSHLRQLPPADGSLRPHLRDLRRHRPLPHQGRQQGRRRQLARGCRPSATSTNAVELMDKLAKNETVRSCVTRQWFRYAFGRDGGRTATSATLNAALAAFGRSDFVITDLLVGLSTSKGFRFRAPLVP